MIVTASLGGYEFTAVSKLEVDNLPRDVDGRLVDTEIVTVTMTRYFPEPVSIAPEFELGPVITDEGVVPYRLLTISDAAEQTQPHQVPGAAEVEIRFCMEPVRCN